MQAQQKPAVSRPNPPPRGRCIQTCRQSCAAARKEANIAVASPSSIDAFLASLDRATFERLKNEHGVDVPLAFDSLEAEATFLTMLAVLNTLSAYRSPFHAATGKGAYQNVIRLCVGLYQRGGEEQFSARGLQTIDAAVVAEVWGLPAERTQWPDGMDEPIDLVVQCCRETGESLKAAKYATPAELVLRALRKDASTSDAEHADNFIHAITSTLSPLYDAFNLQPNNTPVYLFKKAYFLLLSLHQRLRGRDNLPPGVYIPDMSQADVPMFVDNVLPTMAMYLGLIDCSEAKDEVLRGWAQSTQALRARNAPSSSSPSRAVQAGPSLTAQQAYLVRAATLDAGSKVVARAKELAIQDLQNAWLADVNEADLDGYLWSVAKDDAVLRSVPRMVERGTVMY